MLLQKKAKWHLLIATALLLAGCHRHNDNHPPKAAISIGQPSVDQVTTYAFSSSGSNDSDGKIVAQRWDFGDGASSADAAPVHTYGASGSYRITLTVTDDDGATASATQTIDITTPAVSAPSGSAAFSVALPQVATVEIPAASFSAQTRMGVWATASADTAADFDLTSQMFRSPLRASREIRVNTGQVQPSKTLAVIANVPAELDARLQEKDELRVFVQVFEDGGEEVLDSFELVPALYDATSNSLRFDLEPGMFTNRRSADETWEAVIVVGSTRTRPAAPTPATAPPGVVGKPIESDRV